LGYGAEVEYEYLAGFTSRSNLRYYVLQFGYPLKITGHRPEFIGGLLWSPCIHRDEDSYDPVGIWEKATSARKP
jgi:hypothetical protein